MNQTIELRQERDFGLKINATFTFVRENFKPLMKALLYIVVPFALIGGIAMGMMQNKMMGFVRNPTLISQDLLGFYAQYFSLVGIVAYIINILTTLLTVVVLYAYMKIYLQGGRNIEVEAVWNESKKYIGRGLIVFIVTSILSIIGFFFCVLPFFYLTTVFSLILPIIIFEDTDFNTAFSGSFNLIKDKWWSTFGLIVIVYLIVMAISTIFALPASIMTMTSMLMNTGNSELILIILYTIANIAQHLVMSLIFIAVAFQYFNLVERRYGTKLAEDIANLGIKEDRPTMED